MDKLVDKLLFAIFLQSQGLQQVCELSPGSAGSAIEGLGLGMTHSHMTSGSNEGIQCKQFARREREEEGGVAARTS